MPAVGRKSSDFRYIVGRKSSDFRYIVGLGYKW